MNSKEMDAHCEDLASRLAMLHNHRTFEVLWGSSQSCVDVWVRAFDENQELVNELTVCRGIETKQAAADMASAWVEGVAVGLEGGAG